MSSQITLKFPTKYMFEVIEAIDESGAYLYNDQWSLSRTGDELTLIVPRHESQFAMWVSYNYRHLVDSREATTSIEEEETYHLPIAP